MALTKSELKKIYGLTGTEIYSGYIDDDYNPLWRGQTKVSIVEEMLKSDGTVAACSDAMKTPLLNANWYIEAGDKDEKYQTHKEFIEKVLLYDMDFMNFLQEALLYPDYGFYVFEKIYKVKDGMIVWDYFAPRTPRSIEKWGISGKSWVGNHPAGITQYVNFTDEATESSQQGIIPWDKLIVFTHKKTGVNFEGESVFRRAYANWVIKQKLYKISAVASERYGVGTPYFKLKAGVGDDTIRKYEELARSIRSNEKSGVAITEDVVEQGFLMPTGGSDVSKMISEQIKHQDKKIYDSILANFLTLGDGGGSYALSKDHSSFFLLAINHIAKVFTGVMNTHIKDLIIRNYGEQEYYPTLCYGDLTGEDVKSAVESVALAVEKGMVTWGDNDEKHIRETLGLGTEEENTTENEPREKKQVVVKQEEVEKKELSDIKKKVAVPSYERSFMKSIADYENYLASEYAIYEKDALEAEEKMRDVMKKTVERAETERKDGVIIISQSTANQHLMKESTKDIDALAEKLRKKWIDSKMQDRIFENTARMASNTYEGYKVELSITPNKIMFDANIRGYKSNVEGLLSNDSRRVKETLELILSTGMEKEVVVKSIEESVLINKNTLKLSVITHARSAYTSMIYEQAEKDGFTFFKVLAPKKSLKTLNPSGAMAGILFSVMTMNQINEWANKKTEGKNPSAVQGLNLHHGAFAYYMPVPSNDLEEQKELEKQQRSELHELLAEENK